MREHQHRASHVSTPIFSLGLHGFAGRSTPQLTFCIGTWFKTRDTSLFAGAIEEDGELKLEHLCQDANLVSDRHWSRRGHAAARVSRLAYAELWRGAGL